MTCQNEIDQFNRQLIPFNLTLYDIEVTSPLSPPSPSLKFPRLFHLSSLPSHPSSPQIAFIDFTIQRATETAFFARLAISSTKLRYPYHFHLLFQFSLSSPTLSFFTILFTYIVRNHLQSRHREIRTRVVEYMEAHRGENRERERTGR